MRGCIPSMHLGRGVCGQRGMWTGGGGVDREWTGGGGVDREWTGGCTPPCTPPEMATEVGGTHHTVMHSCLCSL